MSAATDPASSPARPKGWLHALLTADHFPDLDRKLRRLVWNPLGGLTLAFAIALLCGMFLHPRAYVLAFGLLAVLVLGVAWPWLTALGLRGTLRYSEDRCREGEEVRAEVSCRNGLWWPAWGVKAAGGGLPAVPARGEASASWPFTPPTRGVYPQDPPHLATGFPFGIFEASRAAEPARELIVWPRTFPVIAAPDPVGENGLEGAVSRNKAGSSGDVLGVRPYRRGDSPRRIHWAQTARHDRLIVCEMQSTARPLILVALDDHPAIHAGESREWAVRVAASLCESWMAEGAEVAALVGGVFIPPAAGAAQHRTLLDAFARLSQGPPLAEVLAGTDWKEFRGARVLVSTERGLPRVPAGALAVLLCAAAFAGEGPPAAPPGVWVWIDDPDGVPRQARRPWRGGAA